jgi:hypothetical protein
MGRAEDRVPGHISVAQAREAAATSGRRPGKSRAPGGRAAGSIPMGCPRGLPPRGHDFRCVGGPRGTTCCGFASSWNPYPNCLNAAKMQWNRPAGEPTGCEYLRSSHGAAAQDGWSTIPNQTLTPCRVRLGRASGQIEQNHRRARASLRGVYRDCAAVESAPGRSAQQQAPRDGAIEMNGVTLCRAYRPEVNSSYSSVIHTMRQVSSASMTAALP